MENKLLFHILGIILLVWGAFSFGRGNYGFWVSFFPIILGLFIELYTFTTVKG